MSNRTAKGLFLPFDPTCYPMPTRRGALHVGFLGGLGLSLGNALRLQAAAPAENPDNAKPVEGKARGVINIFLPGGMASQESFDPKLTAPLEYRGPLNPIKTKIDGEYFSELFAQCAGVADKMCIIRSFTHGEAAHERGTQNMFTGYRPSPAIKYPSMGSIVSHEFGSKNNLPPYICVPSMPAADAGSGYLSSAFGPFALGSEPADKNFQVKDLNPAGGVTDQRFERQKTMLAAADAHFRRMEKADVLDAMDSFYQRAYSMISSREAREAFNLAAESPETRNQYGMHPAGQRMLLARRLVAAGARFVTLTTGGWDHHDNINGQMRNNVPQLDQALAALIRDLDQRGMLDSTLVMVTTEFGRTPKINGTAGRDHYPKVYSIVMAGGGLKKGHVHGKSDATGTEPAEKPVEIEDWAGTIYHQLGIDPNKRILAPGPRPVQIVYNSKVIKELIA